MRVSASTVHVILITRSGVRKTFKGGYLEPNQLPEIGKRWKQEACHDKF